MNDLLFYALIIALIYYFFFYLPNKKRLTNQPLTKLFTDQFTQTEPTLIETQTGSQHVQLPSTQFVPDPKVIENLNKEITSLKQKIKEKDNKLTNLQSEIRDLAKRPLKPTNSKSIQTDSESELTNTLDTLIKEVQDLNNSL
jgi:predicted  nucleic acid-binding Zn-ribbon protein